LTKVFLVADFFVLLLLLLIIILVVICFFLFKKTSGLEQEVRDLLFSKSSQSVRYGKMSEQFMPFIESFPFSASNFRFIGTPIDGLAFEDNEVVFCEFKSGNSNLSDRQKKIKQLIGQKKVRWLELRISDKP